MPTVAFWKTFGSTKLNIQKLLIYQQIIRAQDQHYSSEVSVRIAVNKTNWKKISDQVHENLKFFNRLQSLRQQKTTVALCMTESTTAYTQCGHAEAKMLAETVKRE